MNHHEINSEWLTIDRVSEILESGCEVGLSESSTRKINNCRDFLDKKIFENDDPIYGINTGFGALHNTSIPDDDLETLQKNLVMSHACGTGAHVDSQIVRLMLLLKAQGLSYGHSGISVDVVERILDMYNENVLPVVFEMGSLGASGDLAPLAHLSMPILGMGEVAHKGITDDAKHVLDKLGWEPLSLRPKEGLALLNGTQFMSSFGVWSVIQAKRLFDWADTIAAISLDAFDGRKDPFTPEVHEVRGHDGQKAVAAKMRSLLEGSELIDRKKQHVQDPYSFRCVPQVHGASRDMLSHAEGVIEQEINSVTDNPTIFPEEDKIVSAGNFHGQPLALVLDSLAIACAEIASISERRTYKLVSGERGLPPFLVANPGLNSGFMIPQYTAAGMVSQNKQLCTPASVDTIDSSNGQEDHVSMGANSATKLHKVVRNMERVLAIELMNAVQALEFRRPLKTSAQLEKIVSDYRDVVPFVDKDRYLHEDIEASINFIHNYKQ